VPETDALERLLDARWKKLRAGKPPKEGNTTTLTFESAPIGPIAVRPAVPNTVVIQPPRGTLFVELFDKTGRRRLSGVDYTIDGTDSFSGTTDDIGRLRHDDVFPGDYALSFTLEFFDGDDQTSDSYTSPLVVLPAGSSEPERRMLGAVPYSVLARLHLSFNTNKAFLLPTALPAVRSLRKIYFANNPSKLLIVGHADTAGSSSFNDELSLDRAKAMLAYLKDDRDSWLAFYGQSVPKPKRWGAVEDRLMLISMPGYRDRPKDEDGVRFFQRTRKLEVDGKIGPETRGKLVEEYMSLDGASLEEHGLDIDAVVHGAGENFPLDDSGEALDAAPADGKRDAIDRRVELFFFEPEFGIVPAPPGVNSAPGSPQYPKWRDNAVETRDFRPEDFDGPRVIFVELVDAHFRTNSAVVLPEGETPTDDENALPALTSVGTFAAALGFNDKHPGKRVLVAGHTDTRADPDFNQKLSEERGKVAVALLVGGDEQRENFKTLCDGRHTVADYKEILAWVSRAFDDLVFDCDPGKIDDNPSSGVGPVKSFQSAYNTNLAAFGPGATPLAVDGDVGPLTWGAFFDCYELALQRELGVDGPGLKALRDELTFIDDARKSLGFSEYFPIEELGVDNFKSQTNRRVEILFFDAGEEPDLDHAEDDPETSELYLPGVYVRTPIDHATAGDVFGTIHMLLLDDLSFEPLLETSYTIVGADDFTLAGTTDASGRLRHDEVPLGDYVMTVAGRAATCNAVVLTHSVDEPQVRALPSAAERVFEIRVHDAERNFVAGAACTLSLLEETLTATADAQGIATFTLPAASPETAALEWRDADGNLFEQTVFLDTSEGDAEVLAPARLANLGYPVAVDIDVAVALFQMDYRLQLASIGADGSLPAEVVDQLRRIWDDQKCDAKLPSP
jgi:outer membrane protein OmpA-like peptidoglycan-associated protein